MLNPLALPYWANRASDHQQPSKQALAHSFDDLLQKPLPLAGLTMPADRPKCLTFHADHDPAIKEELARLTRAVVFDTHGIELGFSLEDVIGFATRTGQVDAAEISVGILTKSRFLIILPQGMAPETFIQSTGPELWEAGFSFQPWSPMDMGRLVLPEYKVLLDLVDVPPHLFREKEVAGAVGLFGTFLGTVPARDPANIATWTIAAAVDRLERVPEEIALNAFGYEFKAKVHTRNWLRAPLYKAADLPKAPPKVPRPVRKPAGTASDEPAPFVVSRKVLIDICRGRDFNSLSEEIRDFLITTGANEITGAAANGLHGNDKDPMVEDHHADQTVNEAGHLFLTSTGATRSHIDSESQAIPLMASSLATPHLSGVEMHEAGPTMAKGKDIMMEAPQKNQTAVHILKRQPGKKNPDRAPIPTEIGEGSEQLQASTRARRQLPLQDRAATHPTANRRSNSTKTRPALLKPKDVLVGPRIPMAFKRPLAVQTKSKQTKLKDQARKAVVTRNKDGFFEVNVEFAHISALGSGCGLQAENVIQALNEDNAQRRTTNWEPGLEDATDPAREGPDVSFDLDSGEDPEVDEEGDLGQL